ncbi:DNA translocase FtsK [Neobacillus sp. K501]
MQNFLQRFMKDSEPEYDDYEIHTYKQEKSLSLKTNEGVKDLNTRISYQYPKGQVDSFFKQEVNKIKAEKPVRKKRSEQAVEKKHLELDGAKPVKKEIPKKGNEEPIRRTRPFQPTEIPSPVFGFHRPVSKTIEVVEHELSHFLEEDFQGKISLDTQEEVAAAIEIVQIPIESITETLSKDTEPFKSESVIVLEQGELSEPEIEVEPETEPEELSVPEIEVETKTEPEDVIEAEFEEAVVEQTEPIKPKRSHLPFNVMMLKQDRLKWEESKRRRAEKKEIAQPEAIVVEKTVANIQVEKSKEESAQIATQVENRVIVQQEVVQVEEPIANVQQEAIQVEKPIANVQQEAVQEAKPNIIPRDRMINPDTVEDATKPSGDTYEFPADHLLNPPVNVDYDAEWVLYQEELLNQTLQNFNVGANVVNVTQGPSVTRFEVQPEPGVKVNKITNLSDDIKLSLAAKDIRIEAPIPGKHTIGIEVPNQKSRPVFINEIIQSPVFREADSPLTAILGLDISGKPIVTDLKKMPHGLIAGATGSGKSVCINSILVSLLFKASPEDLKLLLIDPKMVELAPYNRIPHLVSPVITDVKAATAALKWAVDEMERRYELFAHTGVRDINRFNDLAIQHKQYSDKLPFIVIVIDELADLMMMSPADVEEAICRIAQKARACGIHLIVATQRPSVDVITGLIKANIPTRVAFSVSSQVDSRTIIDISGAEKLLGRGDMLFLENGSSKPVRLQGTFVSDEEIDLVVGHVREQREPAYLFEQDELLKKAQVTEDEDELFYEACEFIIEQGLASTSSLQRRFKIGYNRAARLMDMLETNGFITSANGSKPREVLITLADLESMQDTGTMK